MHLYKLQVHDSELLTRLAQQLAAYRLPNSTTSTPKLYHPSTSAAHETSHIMKFTGALICA